jgi:hypothetical protein
LELLSLRAYARKRGVNLSAVQKAIQTKRISVTTDAAGRKKIDPAVADIQWAQNTRPDQQERGSLKDFEKTQADLLNMAGGKVTTAAPVGSNGLSIEKAETESIRRQLMELQLAQKRGELVNVSDFSRAYASKIKAANESLNSMADRISPLLAAETNVDEVDKILRSEIRRAMSLIAQEAAETTQ